MTKKICCICQGDYGKFGNNPQPFGCSDKDRACDECNTRYVVPMRIVIGRTSADYQLLEFLCQLAQKGRGTGLLDFIGEIAALGRGLADAREKFKSVESDNG